MNTEIIPLNFDFNRCYLVRQKGTILIDGGPPGKRNSFIRQLKKHGISPGDIRLIVLTHGDFDHIGSAAAFRETTGAKLAIHYRDMPYLLKGAFHWPAGVTVYGKISRFVLKPFLQMKCFTPAATDIVLDDNDFSLVPFGIEGKIIHTPGHTPGSVSVVLGNGTAFIGCVAQNGFPFTRSPKFPVYASNPERLKTSWEKLLSNGMNTVYPGHGRPFQASHFNF